MEFKKMLGIMSIFIISMVILMMSSSYAWYAFAGASTTFDAVTSNEDIKINFLTGAYINTKTAIPISSDEISEKSDKTYFSVDVDNDSIGNNNILINVDLVDVKIDKNLKNKDFMFDLLKNDKSISKGNFINVDGDSFSLASNIMLDNLDDNNFELRIYLLDDGSNQNELMNKVFEGTLSINVVSRLKTSIDQIGADILVDKIVIDGNVTNYLPIKGYYNMSYKCEDDTVLEWDNTSKSLIYNGGSKLGDKCSLKFVSSKEHSLLVDVVKSGDYVKYIGNNGCEKVDNHSSIENGACKGYNSYYVDDLDKGHSSIGMWEKKSVSKYYVNGYRVAYKENGSVYLITAGSPEDVRASEANNRANLYCNPDFVYNKVCKNGVSIWAFNSDDYNKMISKSLGACKNSRSDISCGYNNDLIDNGSNYWILGLRDADKDVYWDGYVRKFDMFSINNTLGFRPVIRLESSVYVTSGNGTYTSPYVIAN